MKMKKSPNNKRNLRQQKQTTTMAIIITTKNSFICRKNDDKVQTICRVLQKCACAHSKDRWNIFKREYITKSQT